MVHRFHMARCFRVLSFERGSAVPDTVEAQPAICPEIGRKVVDGVPLSPADDWSCRLIFPDSDKGLAPPGSTPL